MRTTHAILALLLLYINALADPAYTKQNALPPVTVSSTGTLMCNGFSAILTASGATTYTWSTGANTSSIIVTPSVTTTYTVLGTDANGIITSASITQSVTSIPSFTISRTQSTVCVGQEVTLTAFASVASTFTWSWGNQSFSGSSITTILPNTTTFTLTVIACTTVTGSVTVYVDPSCYVSISENSPVNIPFLYPNPNAGQFTIRLPGLTGKPHLVLVDYTGKQVFERTLEEEVTVLRPGLQKGIYFYSIQQAGKTGYSGKLLVE